jgi:hypothetical protein
VTPVADTLEVRDPVIATRDCLAVNDAGARPQVGERLDDQWKAVGEVVAGVVSVRETVREFVGSGRSGRI